MGDENQEKKENENKDPSKPGQGGGKGDTPAPEGAKPEDYKDIPGNQTWAWSRVRRPLPRYPSGQRPGPAGSSPRLWGPACHSQLKASPKPPDTRAEDSGLHNHWTSGGRNDHLPAHRPAYGRRRRPEVRLEGHGLGGAAGDGTGQRAGPRAGQRGAGTAALRTAASRSSLVREFANGDVRRS